MKKHLLKLVAFGMLTISLISFNPIKVQAVENNKYLDDGNTIANQIKQGVLNSSNLESYLNSLPDLNTPIGKLKFTYKIDINDSTLFPYDYWVQTSFGGITESPYNLDFFEPYYLQYSINISKEDKQKTIEQLKAYQTLVANIITQTLQNKKVKGGFYNCGYKYPHIQAGFYKIQFLTWNNYECNGGYDYNASKITSLHWDIYADDYDFTK